MSNEENYSLRAYLGILIYVNYNKYHYFTSFCLVDSTLFHLAKVIPLKNKSISLIVPALNEENVVGKVLESIYQATQEKFKEFEFILIDDGSIDQTGEIMELFAKKNPNVWVLHNPKNLGLGGSFKRGFSVAKHKYVMLLCGDGGLPAKSLPLIYDSIGEADLVIPYMTNLKQIKSPRRYLLSRTYTNLLNLIFGQNLHYYNGLPVYPRELLNAIEIKSNGFGFQAEILIKLLKSNCTYKQVGVWGAEETGRSFALKPRNIASVSRTFIRLIKEIQLSKPIPCETIQSFREKP